MKYKVGDKVRVRDDLVAGERYLMEGEKTAACYAVSGMVKKRGTVVTITDIVKFPTGERRYNIGDDWSWTTDMFAGLANKEKIVITHDGKNTTATLYDGKKQVKSAVATCSEDDEFSFATGAKLATERLFEKPRPTVGDWVRIVDTNRHEPLANAVRRFGPIAKIICDDKSTVPYKIILLGDHDEYWVKAYRVEKCDPPEQRLTCKVVCTANGYPGRLNVGGFTVGRIYEVINGRVTGDDGWTSPEWSVINTLEDLCSALGNTFIELKE